MEKNEKPKLFGLLGRNISYSFSRGYFSEKFELLQLKNHKYINLDIASIDEFSRVLQENKDVLCGLNVTIPYKQEVIKHLDKIHPKAKKIGAVNTIRITKKGNLKGYNTDEYGFRKSLKPLLKRYHKKALILGTGGASKAIAHALKKLKIDYKYVSRSPKSNQILYKNIDKELLKEYTIIINCTPIGTYPNVNECPAIPYQFINEKHLLYDLIYNPKETSFLHSGKIQGAIIKNGQEMLELQAEKAWKIWNK